MLVPCRLPELPRICQSIAMLDAVLMPDWELRYYSFNAHWGPWEMMASMRNGGADHYFILLNRQGALIKGYAPDTAMGPLFAEHQLTEAVPAGFRTALDQPAFRFEEKTFCQWATWELGDWCAWPQQRSLGDDPDGSRRLLSILDGNPRNYQHWAEGYYERPLAAWAVDAVYAHQSLGHDLVHALNPNRALADLEDDVREIGYPTTPPLKSS